MYSSFVCVKGILDSDDLPLNVNREQLQKSKLMKQISKKLTKKVLNMIKSMAYSSEIAYLQNMDDKNQTESESESDDKVD